MYRLNFPTCTIFIAIKNIVLIHNFMLHTLPAKILTMIHDMVYK